MAPNPFPPTLTNDLFHAPSFSQNLAGVFWSVTGKQVYQPGNGGVDTFTARNSPATKQGCGSWEINKQKDKLNKSTDKTKQTKKMY